MYENPFPSAKSRDTHNLYEMAMAGLAEEYHKIKDARLKKDPKAVILHWMTELSQAGKLKGGDFKKANSYKKAKKRASAKKK